MSTQKKLIHSEAVPIFRSFQSDGAKYIHGYACLFNTPDKLGTTMTKECVEANIPRLRKFPAVRFMHRVAFGQIVFDQTINGQKTQVTEHGFHVLIKVYNSAEKEFSMVVNGKWGLSYGFLPAKDGIERVCPTPNNCYDAFVKGVLYEISLVDTPAHEDAVAYVIRRVMNGHLTRTGEPIKLTMRDFELIQIHEDGTRSLFKPEEKTVKVADPPTDAQLALRGLPSKELTEWEDPLIKNKNVPRICDPSQCEIEMCPNRFNRDAWGKLCRYRTPPNPKTPQVHLVPISERSLDPNNLPDYHSPQFREETEKPKKEMKESLSPM